MNITYTPNPLNTVITLDEADKKELWYKIKIEQIEEIMLDARMALEDDKHSEALDALDPDRYEENIDKRCDRLYQYYLESLAEPHSGDCTCVAASCIKCHAEAMLGINTIEGLEKHSAAHMNSVSALGIDAALEHLKNYEPELPTDPASLATWAAVGGFHVERWKQEARLAYDWLLKYKAAHNF